MVNRRCQKYPVPLLSLQRNGDIDIKVEEEEITEYLGQDFPALALA